MQNFLIVPSLLNIFPEPNTIIDLDFQNFELHQGYFQHFISETTTNVYTRILRVQNFSPRGGADLDPPFPDSDTLLLPLEDIVLCSGLLWKHIHSGSLRFTKYNRFSLNIELLFFSRKTTHFSTLFLLQIQHISSKLIVSLSGSPIGANRMWHGRHKGKLQI